MSARAVAMHGKRRLDAQLKRERVAGALDACLASGSEITIAAIARRAGVSRKFIYSHPDLRAELELRALRATESAGASGLADARVTGASLRADAENLKAQNQRLRQQVRALERRLSETLGSQIADELPRDERVKQPGADALQERLEQAAGQVFELEEALAAAREELDAVREINRELLSQRNRPPASSADAVQVQRGA